MNIDEVYSILSELVYYNPRTGYMIWKIRENDKRWSSRFAGRECGSVKSNGYREFHIKISQEHYYISAHRLAWFIYYGEIPDEIDHIDQNRSNNKINNLRDVSSSINHRNKKLSTRNTSGYIGISWNKTLSKWHVSHRVEGKDFHLGYFSNIEDAKKASKHFLLKNDFTKNHGAI